MATEKRLIEANALVVFLKDQREKETGVYSKGRNNGLNVAISAIQNEEICPAVEAAPVVHGRWIFGTANHREYMKCSVCLKSQTPTGVFAYCPNCGAKMDGGAVNG